jgi:membrane protease YdiL (CAAX protease family)
MMPLKQSSLDHTSWASSMSDERPLANWRAIHGGVFLATLAFPILLPAWRQWPWLWLVPLAAYLTLVALLSPLRRTFSWFRLGRCDLVTSVAAIAIVVLSSCVLVLYDVVFNPDLRSLGAALPVQALGGVLMAGLVFAVLNATLEELVFRGVLLDALEAQWGPLVAVLLTAAVFGLGHLSGYPPGPSGAVLAGLYGVLLGWLRVRTGGLLLPIMAHIVADAAIYGIVVHSGAVGNEAAA